MGHFAISLELGMLLHLSLYNFKLLFCSTVDVPSSSTLKLMDLRKGGKLSRNMH